jgi:protein-L-isoaspartate(D-aspartate) O-methyltransferase
MNGRFRKTLKSIHLSQLHSRPLKKVYTPLWKRGNVFTTAFDTYTFWSLIAASMVDDYKHKGARKKLVELLATKGITDTKVLSAILSIPRHYFFSKTFHSHAYEDKAFPIGEGQTISQPYTVAYQTQVLHVTQGDKILEIGTGSGYQAAVLMQMGAKLYSIERHEALSVKASTLLQKLGYSPVLKCGDGTKGWAEKGPFDKIIVTAGAPVVPDTLVAQLKIGGIMVIPVGDNKKQRMLSIVKTAELKYETIELDYFAFVPLIGEKGWKQ